MRFDCARFRSVVLSSLLLPLLASSQAQAEARQMTPKERLQAATTWMYQIQHLDADGAVAALAATEYPLLVLEPGNNLKTGGYDTAAMLSALRTTPSGNRRLLIAYIDIGEAESYRSYWDDSWTPPQGGQPGSPDFLLETDPDGWSENYPVAYWRSEWQTLWLSAGGIVETLARLGFDGVYLDWVEAYDDTNVAAAAAMEGIDPARAMMDFIAAIRATGRGIHPDFLVVPQNAPRLIDSDPARYASIIDALGVEDTWFKGSADADWGSPRGGDQPVAGSADLLVQYRKYLERGLPVFSVDYCLLPSNADLVYRQARQADLRPLVTRISLSRLTVTPPDASWRYVFLAGAARADGARQVPIAAQGSLQNPAFSPEGWSLLFTAFRGGYNAGAADLGVQDLGGSGLRMLVANGTANVNLPASCWNGRSRQIVFSSSRAPHDEVYRIQDWGSTGSETQVTRRADEQAWEPSLSPDGQWIVFESHLLADGSPGSLVTCRADGTSGHARLTDPAEDCRQPVWSPAGDLIVYQKLVNGQWDIWVMRPDGTGQRQVTSGDGDKTDPSFSPDGSRIVCSSSEGGLPNANLFVIPTAGGASTRVTTQDGYDGAPSWSPDGRWIAFESASDNPDGSAGTTIWVIAAPSLPQQGAVISDPALTSPAPGSRLSSSAATFAWSAGTGVSQYWLWVGSTAAGYDLFNQGMGTSLSASLSGLPTDGRNLYVRLWFLRNGAWLSSDATFLAASGVGMKVVPPTEGVCVAAFPEFGPTEDVVETSRITDFEGLAGKRIAWAYFSNNWDAGIVFPANAVARIRAAGTVPYVRMMPWSVAQENREETVYTMQRILSGEFDPQLAQWARDARASGGPLMVEFCVEVNGDWFPWSGRWNGGADGGPQRYRDACRHVIDLCRAQGADNLTWVFHVDAVASPAEGWNSMAAYYPGDDYVDWIGISVYGAQSSQDPWVSFEDVLGRAYDELAAISRTKPLAVLEWGVREGAAPTDKASWIRDALASVRSGRFPRIRAMSYWHEAWENDDGSTINLRIDSSAEALDAYRQGIADPFFVPAAVVQ